MKEIWKAIPNYEDYYISTLGRVKSLKKDQDDGRILTPFKFNNNYYVSLVGKCGKHHDERVSGLMFKTFYELKKDRWKINYLDGCKNNSALTNIELVNRIKCTYISKNIVKQLFILCFNAKCEEDYKRISKYHKIPLEKLYEIENGIKYKHIVEPIRKLLTA